MELRIGYYPVLDAALVLRQAYEPVRFSPFNPAMQGIQDRLSAAEQLQVEEIGKATDGWLSILGTLLEPGAAGLKGAEEGLTQLAHEPQGALPLARKKPFQGMGRKSSVPAESSIEAASRLLGRILRTGIAPEAARRSRCLLEASEAIARGMKEAGPWSYLLSISDRLQRTRTGEIAFRIKPEFRMKEADVERMVVTPSLIATRRLTFWRNGGTLLFLVASSAPGNMSEAPDGLLLTALAVGDRTRLRMLRRLAEGPATNLEMAEFLGMNPSTASRHFKVFKDAGFVELREGPDGRADYELMPEGVEAGLQAIAAFIKGGVK
jgi:DNA-binding transcriptional ArsR family regulator